MPPRRRLVALGLLSAALVSTPVLANEEPPAPAPYPAQDDGDRVTIGFGLGIAPDYEGSDDYRLQPGGILQGKVAGVEFQMRGLNLYTDLIPDKAGSKTRLVLGPVVQVRPERNGDIADPRVAQLGSRGTAVELGLTAGVGFRGVLIPPASLNFDLTFLHDIGDTHGSYLLTPSLSLSSPVTRRSFARLAVSADFVGGDFARTYYSVAPGNTLPAFATSGGGHKSTAVSLLYTHDLGGEPRKGWGLFALANYKRLHGEFARSPIVSQAGSADQVFAVGGISYSF